ncbi:MAG: rhodanese-like domain-containing protein [Chitinophagales bacterium]|nr:rhodanese-like domain-containing protein [Chitinophagales bacterium]
MVLHSRSGQRSANAIKALEEKYGFKNLYNLKDGILAWAQEVDTSVPRY